MISKLYVLCTHMENSACNARCVRPKPIVTVTALTVAGDARDRLLHTKVFNETLR